MNPMRRQKQLLDPSVCVDILKRGRECILALAGTDTTEGYPYAVPVNYVYRAPTTTETNLGHLLIHGASRGTKLDIIAQDTRVSACIVDAGDLVPEELTTYFRSVVIFGRAQIVDSSNTTACRAALEELAAKYAPKIAAEIVTKEIDSLLPHTAVIDVTINKMTGKEAIELVRNHSAVQ